MKITKSPNKRVPFSKLPIGAVFSFTNSTFLMKTFEVIDRVNRYSYNAINLGNGYLTHIDQNQSCEIFDNVELLI